MTGTDLALTLIVGLLVVLVLLVAVWLLRGEAGPPLDPDPLDLRRADRVYVTLNDDQTFIGDLTDIGDRTIALRNASTVNTDGTRTTVDGTLIVPRNQVAYYQAPRSTAP